MKPPVVEGPKTLGKGRFEAFSDGVFAIASTLLVLELSIGESGTALNRILEAWPHYLAYLLSFLTIGAAWLAHTSISDRLRFVDPVFLRINLVLLLFVGVLPFPTGLVATEFSGEPVFVVMYGVTLMAIRLLLFALDEHAFREGLFEDQGGARDAVRRTILPVFLAYMTSILIGLLLPAVAIALYCALAIVLVIPGKALRNLLFRSHTHRPKHPSEDR